MLRDSASLPKGGKWARPPEFWDTRQRDQVASDFVENTHKLLKLRLSTQVEIIRSAAPALQKSRAVDWILGRSFVRRESSSIASSIGARLAASLLIP
ncbi:hypothetical protein TgHK011_002460 [Trichoderma gracile]|nr:hypothetical protein TgHK011_002460 [Trichoderma gracile]